MAPYAASRHTKRLLNAEDPGFIGELPVLRVAERTGSLLSTMNVVVILNRFCSSPVTAYTASYYGCVLAVFRSHIFGPSQPISSSRFLKERIHLPVQQRDT